MPKRWRENDLGVRGTPSALPDGEALTGDRSGVQDHGSGPKRPGPRPLSQRNGKPTFHARLHHRRDRLDRSPTGPGLEGPGRRADDPLAELGQDEARSRASEGSGSSGATLRKKARGRPRSRASTRWSTWPARASSPGGGTPPPSGRSAIAGSTARTGWSRRSAGPGRRPSVLVQGSAIGYYGSTEGDEQFTESSPAGSDFLAVVCRELEDASKGVEPLGVRLATIRTGVVLARGEGALGVMAPSVSLGPRRRGSDRERPAMAELDPRRRHRRPLPARARPGRRAGGDQRGRPGPGSERRLLPRAGEDPAPAVPAGRPARVRPQARPGREGGRRHPGAAGRARAGPRPGLCIPPTRAGGGAESRV